MSAEDLAKHEFRDESGYCRRCGRSMRTINYASEPVECEPVQPARQSLQMQAREREWERWQRENGVADL